MLIVQPQPRFKIQHTDQNSAVFGLSLAFSPSLLKLKLRLNVQGNKSLSLWTNELFPVRKVRVLLTALC